MQVLRLMKTIHNLDKYQLSLLIKIVSNDESISVHKIVHFSNYITAFYSNNRSIDIHNNLDVSLEMEINDYQSIYFPPHNLHKYVETISSMLNRKKDYVFCKDITHLTKEQIVDLINCVSNNICMLRTINFIENKLIVQVFFRKHGLTKAECIISNNLDIDIYSSNGDLYSFLYNIEQYISLITSSLSRSN